MTLSQSSVLVVAPAAGAAGFWDCIDLKTWTDWILLDNLLIKKQYKNTQQPNAKAQSILIVHAGTHTRLKIKKKICQLHFFILV